VHKVKGDQARLGVLGEDGETVVTYGWVALKDFETWTISEIDWAKISMEAEED